jgi:SPP1 gp7 family putative phage head morphogenesis protein
MDRKLLAHRIATRKHLIPRRLPRLLQPDAIRLRYFTKIRKTLIADLRRLVLAEFSHDKLQALAAKGAAARGVKQDAAPEADDVGEILDEIRDRLTDKWSREKFTSLVQPFASDTANFHAGQMNRQLESIAGVDVVGNEPWLRDVLGAFTRENVALIKSIPEQTLGEIEKMLTGSIADGDRWENMAEELEGRLGVAQSRANLIARDQVGKLYGDLNRVRQTDLGFDRYIWRTMRDNRVRPEHEDRDGLTFEWASPPAGGPESGGNPGEAIQCRCYAEPDLAHLLESEGIDPSGIAGLEPAAEPEAA